jgi:hypothetical protein
MGKFPFKEEKDGGSLRDWERIPLEERDYCLTVMVTVWREWLLFDSNGGLPKLTVFALKGETVGGARVAFGKGFPLDKAD